MQQVTTELPISPSASLQQLWRRVHSKDAQLQIRSREGSAHRGDSCASRNIYISQGCSQTCPHHSSAHFCDTSHRPLFNPLSLPTPKHADFHYNGNKILGELTGIHWVFDQCCCLAATKRRVYKNQKMLDWGVGRLGDQQRAKRREGDIL